jgi:hypothetical protein
MIQVPAFDELVANKVDVVSTLQPVVHFDGDVSIIAAVLALNEAFLIL